MVKVKEDLTGKTFGRLTVLYQDEDHINSITGKRSARWVCECSCEEHTIKSILGSELRTGGTQSCGCLARENTSMRSKKENKKDLSGEYGVIWTINTNEEVYFDLEDAAEILKHSWSKNDQGYAITAIDGKHIKMHIFLGMKWHDHHNQNKLDNRKENLWPCTMEENNRNVPKGKNNTSGFIGVHYDNRRNNYVASICVSRKRIYLGAYENKEDAVVARLKAESKYFKDFAPQRHLFEQYKINELEAVK